MRNFKQSSVAKTEAFTGSYAVGLNYARAQQKSAPANISYTIEGEELNAKVYKHEGFLGGQPPYQEIVHKEN
jgi:hypothetical protein